MMKKLLCLCLSLLLVLSFAACDSEDDDDDRRSSKKSNSSASADYESAFELLVKYIDGTLKESELKKMLPEDEWNYIAKENDQNVDELCEEKYEALEEKWAGMVEQYGDGYRVEYKVISKTDIDEEEFEEFKNSMEYCGLDADSFGKGYAVTVELILTGENGEEEERNELAVVQYKGAWYISTLMMYGV